jgi:hypothetical protein
MKDHDIWDRAARLCIGSNYREGNGDAFCDALGFNP